MTNARTSLRLHREKCAIAACLALASTGCSLLFHYDDPVAERTAALCSDGIDNDFDGKTDCDSPDCDGYCPELDGGPCADGRDNDGDGLVDGSDASCWPVVPMEARRCASLDAVDFEESFDGSWRFVGLPGWTWFGVEAAADGISDTTPYGTAKSFELPDGSVETRTGVGQDAVRDGTCFSSEYFCCQRTPGPCVLMLVPERARLSDAFVYFLGLGPRSTEPLGAGSVHWDDPRGLVADRTFELAGDFQLTFAAGLTPNAELRVGFLRVATYPPGEVPSEASLTSLAGVEILAEPDGSLEVALLSAGQRESTRVRVSDLADPEVAAVRGGFYSVELRRVGAELHLGLGPEGADPTVDLALPATDLPPARLALWARTAVRFGSEAASQDAPSVPSRSQVDIDDVRLRAAADAPCGRPSPEIPFVGVCHSRSVDPGVDIGLTVSAAQGGSGAERLCLLATERQSGAGSARSVVSWRSPDERVWSRGGELAPAAADETTGAGVTFDRATGQFRAVVSWLSSGTAHLGVTKSEDCLEWTPIQEILGSGGSNPDGSRSLLPPELEPPSYVIRDRHEIYFTAPPDSETSRTLWRATSPDGTSFTLESAPVLEFDKADLVGAPVSATAAGVQDLLFTYPISPESGLVGAAALVATGKNLREVRRAAPWPLVAPSSQSVRFDDVEVLSGSVVWEEGRALLLYGGRGYPFGPDLAGNGVSALSVGSAELGEWVSPGGADSACGDGACAEGESCATCPGDCGECPDGELVFSDSFADGSRWLLDITNAEDGATYSNAFYTHPVAQAAYWGAARGEAWYRADLPFPITGDFELRAKVRSVRPPRNVLQTCSLYVGLAAPRESWIGPGYFAQMITGPQTVADVESCLLPSHPAFVPTVITESRWESTLDFYLAEGNQARCSGVLEGRRGDVPYQVVLRRRSNRLTLSVRDPDGCGVASADGESALSLDDLGAVGPVQQVRIGFQPRLALYCGTEERSSEAGLCPGCVEGTGWVDDVEVWSLDCDEGADECTACGLAGSDRTERVNLATDPSHCGSCEVACAAPEKCVDGSCACLEGYQSCPGVGCVDLQSDTLHCGACGTACGAGGECLAGRCDPPASCEDPATLPADGGQFEVDLARHLADAGDYAYLDAVFLWTPSRSGTVTVRSRDTFETEGIYTTVEMSDTPSCPPAFFASDSGWTRERIEVSVEAGQTYQIAVGTNDINFVGHTSLPVLLEVAFE